MSTTGPGGDIPQGSASKESLVNFKEGTQVQDWNGNRGVVRWVGKLKEADMPPNNLPGTYVAVQFPNSLPYSALRTDGTWNGVQRCSCPPFTCEFIKRQHVIPHSRIVEGIAALRASVLGPRVAHLDDDTLRKFCIARKLDLKKVMAMLEEHLRWTEECKPSTESYFPPTMAQDYPIGFCGLDKEGNLLTFERPGNAGKCPPAQFLERYTADTIMRWHACWLEMARAKMAEEGSHGAKRVTAVVDLTNVGPFTGKVVKFLRQVAKLDQNNYPEHLAHLLLINAPAYFVKLWKVIRIFVDDRTKAKVQIFGRDNYKDTLAKHVDVALLPSVVPGGASDAWMVRGGVVGRLAPLDDENGGEPATMPGGMMFSFGSADSSSGGLGFTANLNLSGSGQPVSDVCQGLSSPPPSESPPPQHRTLSGFADEPNTAMFAALSAPTGGGGLKAKKKAKALKKSADHDSSMPNVDSHMSLDDFGADGGGYLPVAITEPHGQLHGAGLADAPSPIEPPAAAMGDERREDAWPSCAGGFVPVSLPDPPTDAPISDSDL